MRVLQEADVLRIMREEWDRKVQTLREDVDLVMTGKVNKQGDVPLLSPELKVKHKKSGLKYTVDSVGPRDVILRTPEGDKFVIDGPELEQQYELE